MLGCIFKYEVKRSLPLYIVWAVIAVILAMAARLKFFSLADMPLFYLMFFSSIGILLYRYYCTMHGKEAELLFSVDLSPAKQMLLRYAGFFAGSIVTTLMIGLTIKIQNEDLGKMLQNLPFMVSVLLTVEVTFSAFTLLIFISTALSISHIRPFSEKQILWFVIIISTIIAAVGLCSKVTETFMSSYWVVTESGELLRSEINNTPSSISFSSNTLIFDVIFSVACMVSMPIIIRKKLMITT